MDAHEASNKRAIYASLAGNVGIALSKFIAAAFSGSSAMLAEAIHSLVDTSNQVLLLLGIRESKGPADDDFPYGRGKAVYFWGLIAIFVFTLGGFYSFVEGVQHLIHPHEIENAGLNYAILGFAFILEAMAWRVGVKEFQETKGDANYIDAVRNAKDPSIAILIFENSADMIGILVAFFGILLTQVTGILYFDGLASMIIGVILVMAALWLAHETKSLLIGESADKQIVQGIRGLVSAQSQIKSIEEITTLHMGPEFVLVNMRVKFDDAALASDIALVTDFLEVQIRDLYPLVKRVYVKAAVGARNHEQIARLLHHPVARE
ncbi:MAG: cation transporter [Caldilineae bacterium]|nr:cation transporter [Anaerolineae bacterium]MCB0206018.1 cation transporter [Anaerolineae bacterium]MCB9155092.1 cation transporter [Caldilineae bacterium]